MDILHPCVCQTVYLNVEGDKAGINLFVWSWSLICTCLKSDGDLALFRGRTLISFVSEVYLEQYTIR